MNVNGLSVQQLRDALAQRGLDTTGNKPVLQERLQAAINEENQLEGHETADETADD